LTRLQARSHDSKRGEEGDGMCRFLKMALVTATVLTARSTKVTLQWDF
jgi:hypothetical protein